MRNALRTTMGPQGQPLRWTNPDGSTGSASIPQARPEVGSALPGGQAVRTSENQTRTVFNPQTGEMEWAAAPATTSAPRGNTPQVYDQGALPTPLNRSEAAWDASRPLNGRMQDAAIASSPAVDTTIPDGKIPDTADATHFQYGAASAAPPVATAPPAAASGAATTPAATPSAAAASPTPERPSVWNRALDFLTGLNPYD